MASKSWLATRNICVPLLGRCFPLWVVPVVLAVAALLLGALWPTSVLEIHAGENGPLVKVIPITLGDRMIYSYVHSIQKGPVEEILEMAPNGHLVVRETDYDMLGVGLPSDVLDGDFVFDNEHKQFRIINMSRDIPVMRVWVASTEPNRLQVEGEKFRLDSLAKPLSLLVIDVAMRPRIVASMGQGWWLRLLPR